MAAQLTWSAASSQHLRDFMAKCPEFLIELGHRAPRSGTVNTLEAAACSGQRGEGFWLALDAVTDMAAAQDAPRHGLNIDVTRGEARGL